MTYLGVEWKSIDNVEVARYREFNLRVWPVVMGLPAFQWLIYHEKSTSADYRGASDSLDEAKRDALQCAQRLHVCGTAHLKLEWDQFGNDNWSRMMCGGKIRLQVTPVSNGEFFYAVMLTDKNGLVCSGRTMFLNDAMKKAVRSAQRLAL